MADTQAQGGKASQHLLESADLQEILAYHSLPLLSLRDLATVACTCTALRDLAYRRDELWRSCAAECHSLLPPLLMSRLPGMQRVEVQDLLQRRHQVQHLLFSPDSRRLAIVTAQQLTMFSVPSGQQLWPGRDLASISEENDMERKPRWLEALHEMV
ncbi:hypothetical protein WJX73_008129 [Symbiochloris irregularis]|uniref:F-box domain-containing protein n=1 Tax=Symbiochloris irregularis TaxID=706552 RepID=A0AAW1NSU8_9CHLO